AIKRGVEIRPEDDLQTLGMTERLEAANQGDRRQGDAALTAEAAEHDDGEDRCRLHEGERLRADEALARGEESAGKTADHGAGGKRGEFGDGGVDAERAASDLVLAHGFPSAPDRQMAQAPGDKIGEERERKDDVVEKDDGLERIVFDAKDAAKGY